MSTKAGRTIEADIWFRCYGLTPVSDYLRGDIPVKGGLTTMLKTAHLAEAFHMNYEVHHGGNSSATSSS